MPNMKRWSDAKLDKETAFAQAALNPNDQQTVAWLRACFAEMHRRSSQSQ